VDPILATRLAPADDDAAAPPRNAPLTLDEVLGHPDDDCSPRDAEGAIEREIFGYLVTP
jgi:hypothetical protein